MNDLTQFNKAMQRAMERRAAQPIQVQPDRLDDLVNNELASTHSMSDVEYQSYMLALMKTHIHNKSHLKEINK